MRTETEMMELILQTAMNDDRIRAVAMDGSRANADSQQDNLSDFDIVYFVTDIRTFTQDLQWIDVFGDRLITQFPDDWYSHPYQCEGREPFAILMQFADGNRIDLTLVDLSNPGNHFQTNEPRVVLLKKDELPELVAVSDSKVFYITQPTAFEFMNITNEFRWLILYVSKGLCRNEFPYARHLYEGYVMDMFVKMLSWKIGIEHHFRISVGLYGKYLKRYMTQDEMNRYLEVLPNGTLADMWDKLFRLYDFFADLESTVAAQLGFTVLENERLRVRAFLEERFKTYQTQSITP